MMTMTTDELGGLVCGFAITHIGLSAVREGIIDAIGTAASRLNLVGRPWRLPSFWFADTNGLEVWPDASIAGARSVREPCLHAPRQCWLSLHLCIELHLYNRD